VTAEGLALDAALVAAGCLWLLGFLFLFRIPRAQSVCRTGGGAARRMAPGRVADVSVIIPARNEEGTLPALLASIAAQETAPREVIVVDDHSSDATARVARDAGARVITAAPLPPGWLGKPWACAQGAAAAGGDLLLFLDADTALEPGGLAAILGAYAERSGLVSIWPWHRMQKPYEWLSAFFLVVVMAGMRVFTPLGRRLRPLGAFGPCILCSRRDYGAAGGHEAVRSSVLEDVDLGRAFLAAGREVHCLGGRGTISFRMYPDGVKSLVTGFTKNMASGASAASLPILLMVVAWICGGCLVTFEIVRAAVIHGSLAAWLVMDALYAAQAAWWLLRLGTYPVFVPLLYQVPLVFFGAVFVQSLFRTRVLRRVSWKGRSIDLGPRA
jgi:4,4'-diaponeurosporenoate glycosyltransferase